MDSPPQRAAVSNRFTLLLATALCLFSLTFSSGAPARADNLDDDKAARLVEPTARQRGSQKMPAPLWDYVDQGLQKRLGQSVAAIGLSQPLAQHKLAVALVDITDMKRPRVAALNGDDMMYAASLPKIAVLLAAFEKTAGGEMKIDQETEEQLLGMIRRSDDIDTTAVMHKVGKEYINQVLASPRYRLYDTGYNGGLWVGKDYGKDGLWRRDPLHNLSHGATAMQVARFYYLLETGKLVNPEASRRMKEILAHTAINHKFKLGLSKVRSDAEVYRKSGTWGPFHADSAIIERDGGRYIAVAIAENQDGGHWMEKLIGAMDGLVGEGVGTIASTYRPTKTAAARQATLSSSPKPALKQKKG